MNDWIQGYDAWKTRPPEERPPGNDWCVDCRELGGLCDDCARGAEEEAADLEHERRRDL